jgi:hypothetical protein
MRTVVAVTAPVLLAVPKALTQSPTESAVAVVDWVSDNVVVDEVVTLSFCVLTVGFLVDFDLLDDGRVSWLSTVPDSETVEPLTAVTLPVAMAKLAAPGNDRRVPELPLGGVKPEPELEPDRRKPPANPPGPAPAPAPAPPKPDAHEPDDEGWLIVMDRAAMVVLDFLEGVPVTMRQSPVATALRVLVAVWLKVVDGVQVTEVCPSLALCTSMVVPEIDATLPLAPDLVGVAAPAPVDIPRTTDALRATIAAGAIQVPSPRLLRGELFIVAVVSLVFFLGVCATYSLLRASMGARLAARLAG